MTSYIGQPISRLTGAPRSPAQAKYAAEYNVPNLAFGFVVSSAIAKGKNHQIDTSEALRL